MKNQKKVFKALADAWIVKELGKAYQKYIASEAKIKKPQNLYYNIGLCYELIGNYTKAKENYLKSGDSNVIIAIESLIKIQELFKSLGLDVTEGEF
jgi:tetratricopeptide (TPR) repeat protein